jgi:hypothetical protein
VRHSLNIVVAMLSMAAGAWQGTTAQTEQPGSAQGTAAASPLTLRGCVQKGQAAGTFLLVMTPSSAEPGLDPAPAAQSHLDGSTAAVPTSRAVAQPIAYELVAGKPDLDLTTMIGKRVDAQGTPERTARGASADDSPSAAEAAADGPTASRVGTAGHTSQRSRVRVTAIRPVSGSCE